MASSPATSPRSVVSTIGDARWVRAHISTLAVAAVILVSTNLLIASDELWSLTVIGIWSMLLVVHVTVLIIARLSVELIDDDEEEIVLLPVQDAVIVHPTERPAPAPMVTTPSQDNPAPDTTVSWQVATDAAQARREPAKDTPAQ